MKTDTRARDIEASLCGSCPPRSRSRSERLVVGHGTQQSVVGVVGTTPPLGEPPMAGHDAPVGCGAATSMMRAGSLIEPQVVTWRGMPLPPQSVWMIAGHEPATPPQVHSVQARSSFASP